MDQAWKFSDIPYQRPDYQEMQRRLDALTAQVAEAADFAAVEAAIDAFEALEAGREVMGAVCFARMYHDVTVDFWQQEMAYMDENAPLLRKEGFIAALGASPFRAQIDERYGSQYLTLLELQGRLHGGGKELQALCQSLESRYQQTKATLRYEVGGEEVSEGRMLQVLLGPDRALRKEAYEASLDAILAKKDELAALLRQLVTARNDLAKANGFASYLDYGSLAMGRLGYGQRELEEFCQAVKEHIVPLWLRLQREQSDRLDLHPLLPYDRPVLFSEGNPRPVTGEALSRAGAAMYHGLSPEAGAFYEEMVARELLDVEFSDHKISGMGFCTDLPAPWKMPFVFANNNGTDSDVAVYTHELGHAFQAKLAMATQPVAVYANGGPDFNEIHSKTMELLAEPYFPLFFGAEADRALYKQRYDIVKEMVAFCWVHTFETWLYQHPDETLEAWAAEYQRTAEAFGMVRNAEPWMDKLLQGAKLLDDMCIFFSPLYVVSYALSQVCALALKEAYDQDPAEGWAKYRALCAVGSSKPYDQALADAGLRLPYTPQAVTQAAKTLKKLLWKDENL